MAFFFSRFEQLSEKFDLFPLYFGNQPVFLLSLPDLDVLNTLGILICNISLSLNDRLLDQFQAFSMHLFDFVLLLGPFSDFLVLHQLSPQVEAGLIRNRWKRILKPVSLSVQLNIVQDINRSRQAVAVGQMLEGQHFRFFALTVYLLRRIRVRLALGFSVVRLHIDLFGL